jgi:hypothetical protein
MNLRVVATRLMIVIVSILFTRYMWRTRQATARNAADFWCNPPALPGPRRLPAPWAHVTAWRGSGTAGKWRGGEDLLPTRWAPPAPHRDHGRQLAAVAGHDLRPE